MGFNLHRRLVVGRKLPRDSAGELLGLVAGASTDYTTVNQSNFLELIDHAAHLGAEAWWLDAGWFNGGVCLWLLSLRLCLCPSSTYLF